MKKFLGSIFTIILLATSVLFHFGFTRVSQDDVFKGESKIEDKMQEETSIYTSILSNHRVPTSRSENEWVYDDTFAGIWYDTDGNLNIGITDSIAMSRTSAVAYNIKKFSYNFLNEIHLAVVSLMSNYSIHSVGIMQRYNKVKIELYDETHIDNVLRHLSRLEFFENDAVSFTVSCMPTPTSIENETSYTNLSPLSNNLTPIHAGSRITHIRDGFNRGGTISAKATCNITGRRGIITNAHVSTSRPYTQTHRPSGRVIGTVAQSLMVGVADAAFIPFENPNSWEFSSSASWLTNPTNDFWTNNSSQYAITEITYKVASRDEIIEGAPVVKFGQTTGRTTGIIDFSTSVIVGSRERPFYDGSYGRLFTDQIVHTANALPGDSGSPVFIVRDGKYILAATHFAGGRYASKITNIEQALNVTIEARSTSGNYWLQPNFTSPTNDHGAITASVGNHLSGEQPFQAFNGGTARFDQWSKRSTSGWIQLNLNYDIIVDRIIFYNRESDNRNWTQNANFTAGENGVPLGAPFTAEPANRGRRIIDVGGVRTNVIRLNVTSATSGTLTTRSHIGAHAIVINARVAPVFIPGNQYFPLPTSSHRIQMDNIQIPNLQLGTIRRISNTFFNHPVTVTCYNQQFIVHNIRYLTLRFYRGHHGTSYIRVYGYLGGARYRLMLAQYISPGIIINPSITFIQSYLPNHHKIKFSITDDWHMPYLLIQKTHNFTQTARLYSITGRLHTI